MPYLHAFGTDDILINRMVTRPRFEFVMYSGSVHLNNERDMGENIPTGSVSLFEYNVDRDSNTPSIAPQIVRGGFHQTIGSITGSTYTALTGNLITGNYSLTSSITRQYFPIRAFTASAATSDDILVRQQFDTYCAARKEIISLKNTLNQYQYMSSHFKYTGSFVDGTVNMIQIPSIFFSDGIKKGSVSLKYYYTGSLLDEAVDSRHNGELISTKGATSGTVVGVVLYNEGFILLTSSVDFTPFNYDNYLGNGGATIPKASWQYFGAATPTGSGLSFATASLFSLSFEGTQKIPTMTMFATAAPGDVNNSLNPTWVSASNSSWRDRTAIGAGGLVEDQEVLIKNTVQSDYCNYEDSFEKQVYISEIAVFDDEKNLLGIAKLANPVLKKEAEQYTFKINLDM